MQLVSIITISEALPTATRLYQVEQITLLTEVTTNLTSIIIVDNEFI